MAYTTNQAIETLNRYLGINDSNKEIIENTKNRGFVFSLPNGEKAVVFVYPLVHKQDNTKNYFDTRDSGAYERGITWNYAIDNNLKYFCIGVNDTIDKYDEYAFSLECNESDIEKISGTANGSRNGPGNQIIIPNDYVPSKQVERIANKLGIYIMAVHKDNLIDYLTFYDNRPYMNELALVDLQSLKNESVQRVLTPEWFNENGKAFVYLDEEAEKERQAFLKKYNPDILKTLEGMTLLRTVFLNDDNKDNLCYELEFNSKLIEIFGSIKSGTAYKYGLHYSKKNQRWATGSGKNPRFLTADEAVELGTEIRDYLVAGAEVLRKYDSIDTLEDYKKLFKELNEATEGYGTRVWFLKYYQMLSPELFPPIYSKSAQETVLNAIGEIPDDNTVIRMGQMQLFIKKCEVSPIVFSRTFWTNYDADSMDEETEAEESQNPIKYETKYESSFPRNRILFGAPGTGKSFKINDDAKELIGEENEDDYERVTFHPDYSYANFVGTYKPVPTMDSDGKDAITYEYVPGPFMRVYVKALKNSRTDNIKPFLLIIEEINRANVAAVFGDIFQLLDRGDNYVSEYPIQASEDIKKYLADELKVDPSEVSKIKIPDNMFIWATMNSADQGVFPMDTAFKRRWDFTYLGIDDNDELIRGKYVIIGSKEKQRIEWNGLRKAINEFLAEEKINEDKQLGPYFISKSVVVPKDGGTEIDSKNFCDAFKNKVLMYLFDDAAKQKRPSLFEGSAKGQTRYSKICEAFDEQGIGIFNRSIQTSVQIQDLVTNEYQLDENGNPITDSEE